MYLVDYLKVTPAEIMLTVVISVIVFAGSKVVVDKLKKTDKRKYYENK